MNIKCVISLILICFNLISCTSKTADEKTLVPEDISTCVEYEGIHYLEGEYISVCRDGKWGFIDSEGNAVIPFEYEWVSYADSYFAILKKDNKYGVTDMKNEVLIPFEYESILYLKYGYFVAEKNGERKLINPEGKIITLSKYVERSYSFFSDVNKVFLVKKDDKCGLIDENGEIVIPIIYDSLNNADSIKTNSFIIAERREKYGVFDYSGHILLPFEYEYLSVAGERTVVAVKDGKRAVIDIEGNLIAPFEDTNYIPIGEGFFTKGTFHDDIGPALFNSKGKKIIKAGKGTGIRAYSCGFIIVVNNDGVALFNFKGKKVIDFDNNQIYAKDNGYFLIEKNDGSYYLWKDGQEIKLEYKINDMFRIGEDGLICAADKEMERVYVFSSKGKLIRCFNGTFIRSAKHYYIVEQSQNDGNKKYTLVPKNNKSVL